VEDPRDPVWTPRIQLDIGDSGEINLECDGLNLMRTAHWPLPAANRGLSLTQQYMNLRDQETWIEARRVLSSAQGISSQSLSDLQAIIQSSLAHRASDCVDALGGRAGPLAEVIGDIKRQSSGRDLWILPPRNAFSSFSADFT